MDQGGGLERLAGLLLRQLLGGQLAQLVVDQRQELLGRLRVALLDGREDAGHVVHHRETPSRLKCFDHDAIPRPDGHGTYRNRTIRENRFRRCGELDLVAESPSFSRPRRRSAGGKPGQAGQLGGWSEAPPDVEADDEADQGRHEVEEGASGWRGRNTARRPRGSPP